MLIEVHNTHFSRDSTVNTVEILLQNADDWVVTIPEIWQVPLSSVLQDFPITQTRYRCSPSATIQEQDNVKPSQRSAFEVPMQQMSTKTALPEKRT
jgi:hypothetical protein